MKCPDCTPAPTLAPTVGRVVHVYDGERGPVPGIVVVENNWHPIVRALSPKGSHDDIQRRMPFSDVHAHAVGIHWCWPARVA